MMYIDLMDDSDVRQSDNSSASKSSSLDSIQSQSDSIVDQKRLNEIMEEIAALQQKVALLENGTSRDKPTLLKLDKTGLPEKPIKKYDELKELNELLANEYVREQFVSGFWWNWMK